MKKDLKELAEKYRALSDTEKMDLEIQAHDQVTSEWAMNRPEEMNSLIGCSWFHPNKLGVEVGGNGRLRIVEGVISDIPGGETKENLKSASDLITDYFTIVVKLLENPDLVKSETPDENDSGEWGTEEFLLGLLNERRGDGFDIFG